MLSGRGLTVSMVYTLQADTELSSFLNLMEAERFVFLSDPGADKRWGEVSVTY